MKGMTGPSGLQGATGPTGPPFEPTVVIRKAFLPVDEIPDSTDVKEITLNCLAMRLHWVVDKPFLDREGR